MKTSILSLIVALAAQQASSHAIFQQLWYQSTCARVPTSNSPITDVSSSAIRCNSRPGIANKCAVAAGQTVTVEMHQQPGDRSCANEAIGGAHYGPVMVYMSKVADATKADGSTGWFKIFQDSWASTTTAKVGDDDNWGTKDLNKCCGRMNVVIPSDIPAGDYLLRAEVIALHTAGSVGGAQFYITCYQLSVTGGGSASPALVQLPGAYKGADPGIKINIHAAVASYVVPGPTVYAGGSTKAAGAACTGVETLKSLPPAATTAHT